MHTPSRARPVMACVFMRQSALFLQQAQLCCRLLPCLAACPLPMSASVPLAEFAPRLIAWQRQHGRHGLPWQVDDPYKVWVSEIMLQQTQVSTVLGYYPAFLQRFPDVAALAAAPLDDVLAAWSGLGYYSRARNLHRAAGQVMTEFAGHFPDTQDALMTLCGVGRSTAAAIAAFAFARRTAILDGNVKRVLTRCYGIDGWPGDKAVENRLWTLAEQLLPDAAAHIATYTQGLMDLGSLLCTRGQPRCGECPLAEGCTAHTQGRQRELPTPRPRKTQPLRSTVMLLVRNAAGEVWLQRRPDRGVWGGLWSLPELATSSEVPAWLAGTGWTCAPLSPPWPTVQHVFTHFRLDITPQPVRVVAPHDLDDGRWWQQDAALALGLPAPVRRLLETRQDSLW